MSGKVTVSVVNDDVLHWAETYTGKPFMAMLCDPPYHLTSGRGAPGGFMNAAWDGEVDGVGIAFRPETWAALTEHLHPGAFIFAFASTRGWHRMACAMEDAGLVMQPSIFVNGARLEIPKMLGWATGQSFPKATDISKQVDKAAGAEREVVGKRTTGIGTGAGTTPIIGDSDNKDITAPATPLARTWEGHRYGGQILRNCLEPIIVCQKPWGKRRLDDIVETGAGALNVDKGRVGIGASERETIDNRSGKGWGTNQCAFGGREEGRFTSHPKGRWPPNLALVHSPGCVRVGTQKVKTGTAVRRNIGHSTEANIQYVQGSKDGEMTDDVTYADADGLETVTAWECEEGCPVAAIDAQAGECKPSGVYAGNGKLRNRQGIIQFKQQPEQADRSTSMYSDEGGPSRFYPQADWSYEIAERLATCAPVRYCAKAGRRERDSGLEAFCELQTGVLERRQNGSLEGPVSLGRNPHVAVKPISLLIWLCNLLTPPLEYAPRRILIPFFGSGSEGVGALLSSGFEEIVGIEQSAEYVEIARARLKFWHGWRERGHTDPAAVLRRTARRATVSEVQMRLGL